MFVGFWGLDNAIARHLIGEGTNLASHLRKLLLLVSSGFPESTLRQTWTRWRTARRCLAHVHPSTTTRALCMFPFATSDLVMSAALPHSIAVVCGHQERCYESGDALPITRASEVADKL